MTNVEVVVMVVGLPRTPWNNGAVGKCLGSFPERFLKTTSYSILVSVSTEFIHLDSRSKSIQGFIKIPNSLLELNNPKLTRNRSLSNQK